MRCLFSLKLVLCIVYIISLSTQANLLLISEDGKLYTAPDNASKWFEHELVKQYPHTTFIDMASGSTHLLHPPALFLLGFDTQLKQPVVLYSIDGIAFNTSYLPLFIEDTSLYSMNISLMSGSICVHGTTILSENLVEDFVLSGQTTREEDRYYIFQWLDDTSNVHEMVEGHSILLHTHYDASTYYRYILNTRFNSATPMETKRSLKVYESAHSHFPSNDRRCVMHMPLKMNAMPYTFKMNHGSAKNFMLLSTHPSSGALFNYRPHKKSESATSSPILSFNNSYWFYPDISLFVRSIQLFFVKDIQKQTYALVSNQDQNMDDPFKTVYSFDSLMDIDPTSLKGHFLYFDNKFMFFLEGRTSSNTICKVILESKNGSSWQDISSHVVLPSNINKLIHDPFS